MWFKPDKEKGALQGKTAVYLSRLQKAVSRWKEKDKTPEHTPARIYLYTTNSRPVSNKAQEKQKLDSERITAGTDNSWKNYPTTSRCYCRCDILRQKLWYLCHTGTTPEEESLCSGSTKRVCRCLPAGKDYPGTGRIYPQGCRIRRKTRCETDLCRYTGTNVSLPSEADHYPVSHQ